MDSPKHIVAIASRYGVVMQHTFKDLYSAVLFLKKGAREGKHLPLGAFDPSNGIIYTLSDCDTSSSMKVLSKSLEGFLNLGIDAKSIEVY
ncbi:hypothetical protein [Rufibacter tibetensis]|uniref:Uncharacterized protein n=1 Tax=Rufibacter tibetensis TaxID=512763 RepID=A0A0P0C4S9_9BACT|nr:hypothetical protein [Rufibacter tibetensis]ALI99873.1 hypothetical protein DC20_13965 [Rufibacter tibetensis]